VEIIRITLTSCIDFQVWKTWYCCWKVYTE